MQAVEKQRIVWSEGEMGLVNMRNSQIKSDDPEQTLINKQARLEFSLFKDDRLILGIWTILGAMIRFSNLEAKPPWADEWATLVFSLGNSFLSIPLDRAIDFATLMQPLQLPEALQISGVISNLLTESTHPPVYFVLTHLWLKLLPGSGIVSVALARLLSVLFGVAGIVVIFGLTKQITNSRLCAHFAAILLAFSPYGVYLAQEVRHYTFAILLVMASVYCLSLAVRQIETKQELSYTTVLTWVFVNSLGVATHYFFALGLVIQVFILVSYLWQDIQQSTFSLRAASPWRSIAIAIIGTISGCLVWLWTWLQIPENQLTDWTKQSISWGWEILEPVGRILGWLTTMIMLLPIEGTPQWLTIISATIVLGLLVWLIIQGIGYWRQTAQQSIKQDLTREITFSYVALALVIILAIAYFGDRDLTLAARFQFFYFPLFVIFVAAILARSWQTGTKAEQRLVLAIIAIAFCGSLTVVINYGYQKPDRADLVVPVVAEAQSLQPDVPVVMAIVHKHHEQTGEMMSIAWEWLRKIDPQIPQPLVMLLHKKPDTPGQEITQKFARQLQTLPRPLNVWVVNFSAPTDLEAQGCQADLAYKRKVAGYRFRLYHCE